MRGSPVYLMNLMTGDRCQTCVNEEGDYYGGFVGEYLSKFCIGK